MPRGHQDRNLVAARGQPVGIAENGPYPARDPEVRAEEGDAHDAPVQMASDTCPVRR